MPAESFLVCAYLDGIYLHMCVCVWELVPMARLEVREDVVCPALSHTASFLWNRVSR